VGDAPRATSPGVHATGGHDHFLALNRHPTIARQCPLLGVKRTLGGNEVARSCAARKSAWHICARDGHAVKALLTTRALLVKI
jgi:hypothetical protein